MGFKEEIRKATEKLKQAASDAGHSLERASETTDGHIEYAVKSVKEKYNNYKQKQEAKELAKIDDAVMKDFQKAQEAQEAQEAQKPQEAEEAKKDTEEVSAEIKITSDNPVEITITDSKDAKGSEAKSHATLAERLTQEESENIAKLCSGEFADQAHVELCKFIMGESGNPNTEISE